MSTSAASPSSSPSSSWLDLAKEAITSQRLDPDLLEVLRAFGGDEALGPASLDPDDDDGQDDGDDSDDGPPPLPRRIASALSSEVDADQAQMFARRFQSVSAMLSAQAGPTANLLRLGLHRRARQILAGDDPTKPGRALRIRALVDFIWSQSLVLSIRDDVTKQTLPSLKQLVERGVDYQEIAPGMRHGLIEGETSNFGPVHINVLRVARGAATIRCVDARAEGCTTLETLADRCCAVAAVSGGFFLYSEPDIEPPSRRTDPVGLLVRDGEVINPPVFKRGALLQDGESGDVSIHKVGMEGVSVFIVSDTGRRLALTVGSMTVKCYHRGQCKTVKITAENMAMSIVGGKIHEVKNGGFVNPVEIDVPLAGFVLTMQALPRPPFEIEPGLTVHYSLTGRSEECRRSCGTVQAGIAGGPILLSEGGVIECASELPKEDFCASAPPVTFSQDETFDRNLLPRMGAGVTADGELVCAAVDGRNLEKALGLTLKGTAELLAALGCIRGLNLDGGSSKRMVIKDKGVVCLHTTEIKSKKSRDEKRKDTEQDGGAHEADGHVSENLDAHEEKEAKPELSRPVYSAILFLPRQADETRKRKAGED